MKFVLSLFLFVGCMKVNKPIDHKELTFVFPHIHHDYNWDVATSGSLWKYFIADNLVEPLVRLSENSQYEPAMASSWQFSKDKKSIKLEINSGYKFHDGKEITAQDVYKSLERVLKLKKTSHSDLSEAICEGDKCSGLSIKNNIIELSLKNVVNGILFNLASPEYGITPSGYGHKDKTFKDDLKNLSGPYKVQSFKKEEMLLVSSKDHPLVTEKSVQNVKIKEITSFDDSIEFYKNNKNVVLIGSDYSSGIKLDKLKGKKYISAPSLTEFFLPNIDSENLDTIEKRKAIFSLIRKAKDDIEINEDLGFKTSQIFTKDNISRLDDTVVDKIYGDSSLKGKSFKVIIFDWMKDTPIVPLIKEELKKNGVALEIKYAQVSELKEILTTKDYDFIYLYSGVSAYDPIIELVYLFNHPLTQFSYKNKEAVDLLSQSKELIDREEYVESLKNIHSRLLSDYRVLPIIHTRMLYVTNSEYTLEDLNHFDGGLSLWDWKLK